MDFATKNEKKKKNIQILDLFFFRLEKSLARTLVLGLLEFWPTTVRHKQALSD